MKIVLDTNVVVSGLLNPHGPPGQIVSMVAAGKLALYYDARILDEYLAVLSRSRFEFSIEHIEALLAQVRVVGELVAPRPLRQRLPDPEDEKFLEAAIAADAAYLVTGNLRHYPASSRQGIEVATPAEFLEVLRESRG
jgi:putative PIN family toxin of toxin-antitoxin system